MFRCKFCSICISELIQFCSHVKSHQHTANYRFTCGVEQCPASFRAFSAFRSHMHRNHHKAKTKHTHFIGNLACGLPTCSYVAENLSTLCSHLRLHIKDGKKVPCPFNLLHECNSAEMNNNQIATSAILLLLNYFKEKEDSIFILVDVMIFSFSLLNFKLKCIFSF